VLIAYQLQSADINYQNIKFTNSNGEIYNSIDGGKSFETSNVSTFNYDNIVFVNSNGKKFKSIDRGKTWFQENIRIVEDEKEIEFDIFPNPSLGVFEINSNNKDITRLTITDISGDIVYEIQYPSYPITINHDFEKGRYYITLFDMLSKPSTSLIIIH
jgi:hypothetical protein